MIEPTKRDEEVYALLLSNRGRVTDLAAYREELFVVFQAAQDEIDKLLAASAQSAETQLSKQDHAALMADIHKTDFGQLLRDVANKAQSAEQREEDFAPAVDPITGAPLFMWIDHPERGMVPTYGGPFDSYTLCERDIDESNSDEIRFYRERFDHDEGAWVEGCESVGFSLITQTRLISLEDSQARARLASKPSRSETPDANDDILNRIIFDAQSWLTRSMDGEHDEVVPAYSDAEIKRRLIAWARPSREEEMR